jgi:hypothetical protein
VATVSAVHALIAWSGFPGAWLLVAGPLFQAVAELVAARPAVVAA